jgi:hypothetical protein
MQVLHLQRIRHLCHRRRLGRQGCSGNQQEEFHAAGRTDAVHLQEVIHIDIKEDWGQWATVHEALQDGRVCRGLTSKKGDLAFCVSVHEVSEAHSSSVVTHFQQHQVSVQCGF